MRVVSCLVALLLLAACSSTPTLRAQTISYHDGLQLGAGKQFAVVAEDGQMNDLEFKHYAERVNTHLHRFGLKQAPSLAEADYRVHFSYSVDDGKQNIVSYPARGYGGVSSVYGSRGYSGVGLGYSMPIYGYGNRTESYTVYTRRFELRIVEANKARNSVYQGRVTSSGQGASFAAVAPCMIAALFENFPGVDGREVSIRLPMDSCM